LLLTDVCFEGFEDFERLPPEDFEEVVVVDSDFLKLISTTPASLQSI